jgi:hypothetical protein
LNSNALRTTIIAIVPLLALSFSAARSHPAKDFRQGTAFYPEARRVAVPKIAGKYGALAPEVRRAAPYGTYEVASSDQRVRLLPKFTSGEVLRYEISTRSTTSGTTTSPIDNPEGASRLKQSAEMIIRLDILDTQPPTTAAMGRVHLRATYEKSDATSETDAYDPQAAAIADQYARLLGRSIEFTIEPDGKFSSVTGLEDILSNPSMAQSVRSWMTGLSSGAGFPQGGIALNQKWGNEQPLMSTPLAGLVWRTASTYLRNEPCRAAAPTQAGVAAPTTATPFVADESCAVILTRFEILHHGSRDELTPEDYRRNSLRTSGTWAGKGESLDAISLSTGMAVSSTQTSTQDINLQITSTRSGSRMSYTGHVETQTEILLLPPRVAKP